MEYLLIAIGVVIVFFFIAGINEKKRNAVALQGRLQKNWGDVPQEEYTADKYNSIQYYYRQHRDSASDIDDITWNDLDMDQIYLLINNTCSAMGEEYLYYLLRKPYFDESVQKERERVIEYFSSNKKERYSLQAILSDIGRVKLISLYEYINRLNQLPIESNLRHYIMLAAIPVSIGLIFVSLPLGILTLISIVIYNCITYFLCKAKVEAYYSVIICIMKTLKAASKMTKNEFSELGEYIQKIQESGKEFKSFRSAGFVVTSMKGSGSLADVFLDYIRMLTHLDLIKFNRMLAVYRNKKEALTQLFETLGFLDSMLAVASFRELIGTWCRPELSKEEGMHLSVSDVYHPVIEEPVANSITTERSVLITGSNASGKSTFIKVIAINAILAQTIATSVSTKYRASFFRIVSSMALKDNLTGNESYYIVEIKSLKRILDGINDEIPTLCFIDEVLRGTNTLERIAASSRILLDFSKRNCVCFAATHDIELTSILSGYYDNYHFQEEIVDGDILFDYTLRDGKAVSKNAIRLLEIMGYSEEIIQDAQKAASYFEQTGSWEKQK